LDIVDPIVITGEQSGDGFGSSLAAGDSTGTGGATSLWARRYDTTEQPDVGRTYEYRGSSQGLGTNYASIRPGVAGAKYATAVANVGDISGDGIDDVAVGAPLASANGPITNGQFFVYFGGSAALQQPTT